MAVDERWMAITVLISSAPSSTCGALLIAAYPMKLIFPSDGFIARLGLIAKVVQQFLQKNSRLRWTMLKIR